MDATFGPVRPGVRGCGVTNMKGERIVRVGAVGAAVLAASGALLASGDIELGDLSNRAKYGMSMALAAAATADVRDALMVQVLSFQDALPETGARAAIHASTNKNLDNNKHIKEALG